MQYLSLSSCPGQSPMTSLLCQGFPCNTACALMHLQQTQSREGRCFHGKLYPDWQDLPDFSVRQHWSCSQWCFLHAAGPQGSFGNQSECSEQVRVEPPKDWGRLCCGSLGACMVRFISHSSSAGYPDQARGERPQKELWAQQLCGCLHPLTKAS